ncbi:9033_t:CDS:2, partial [Acaulospora morrowiae]
TDQSLDEEKDTRSEESPTPKFTSINGSKNKFLSGSATAKDIESAYKKPQR